MTRIHTQDIQTQETEILESQIQEETGTCFDECKGPITRLPNSNFVAVIVMTCFAVLNFS